MAVMALFKNLDRRLPVRDLLAESAETRARLATRRMTLILQRLEAGQ